MAHVSLNPPALQEADGSFWGQNTTQAFGPRGCAVLMAHVRRKNDDEKAKEEEKEVRIAAPLPSIGPM